MLAVLLVVALGLAACLVWMWSGASERPHGPARASTEEASEAAHADPGAHELVLATPPPAGPAQESKTTEKGELEPFAAARTETGEARGKVAQAKRGSLRGHMAITGDEPLPRVWKLVLGPSTTLPGREHAINLTLEFQDGQSDFDVPDLPLAAYDVYGEAEGFNGQVFALALEPGNEHPFVNLRMVPAGTLEGRILDSKGLPAEGIAVTLFAVDGGATREATSDASGVYRFERVLDGAYELMLGKETAPIVRDHHAVRFLAPHLTFPDITLPLLGEVRVRCVDTLERPLEGVEVRGSGKNGGIIEGTTDFDGRLTAKYLPAGVYRIRLQNPAFDPQYAKRIAIEVVPGEVVQVPLVLGP